MDAPLKIRFTATAGEMSEALRLHSRRARRFVFVGSAVVLLIAIAIRSRDEYVDWVGLAVRLVVVIGAAILIAVAYRRRQIAQLARDLHETEMEFADDGVNSRTDVATARRSWAAFRRFVEGRSVILLYLSAMGFLVVPKRALDGEGALDRLRAILRTRIPSSP